MKEHPVIKINKEDKRLFRKFKKTKWPIRHDLLDETIHNYLMDYVENVFRSGSRGLSLYGYQKIELKQEHIEMFLESAEFYANLGQADKRFQRKFMIFEQILSCPTFREGSRIGAVPRHRPLTPEHICLMHQEAEE